MKLVFSAVTTGTLTQNLKDTSLVNIINKDAKKLALAAVTR